MQPVMLSYMDPDRPLNAEELADERWEARRARVRTRAHIERLETALRWALEQIEETPGNRSALADAWSILED